MLLRQPQRRARALGERIAKSWWQHPRASAPAAEDAPALRLSRAAASRRRVHSHALHSAATGADVDLAMGLLYDDILAKLRKAAGVGLQLQATGSGQARAAGKAFVHVKSSHGGNG